MPTLIIESEIDDEAGRRKIARQLTLRLGRLGVTISHILIKWQRLNRSDVFAGALPLVGLPDVQLQGQLTLISIEVDKDRDGRWRRDLIEAVRETFAELAIQETLFVRLVPVDPNDYWNQALEVERRASQE